MDFFLFHGRFWQGEGRFAPAMLVREGRIAAVGEEDALRARAGGCSCIDCGGRTGIPGFYDACLCLGAASSPLPRGLDGLAAGVQTVFAANQSRAKKGARLFWSSAGDDPDRAALDRLWPHSPLLLEDITLGRGWANSPALALLERRGLPQNLACHVAFDGDSRPAGRLSGPACRYLAALLPRLTQREIKEGLQKALAQVARAGITSVQSCDLGLWLQDRDLPVAEQLYRELPALPGLRFFTRDFRGTAARFCGRLTGSEDLSQALWQPGQPIIPCADGPALDAVLTQLARRGGSPDNFRRLTLLGAACTGPRQLRELGRQALGVIGFPQHLERALRDCLGQPGCTMDTCCAFRTLGALGARVAFGGLDGLQPWDGIRKAVCRPGKEALSLEEALACATQKAAWAGFQEDLTGRLAPGYRADIQLLDGDPFTLPPDRLHILRPVLVLAEGRVLHREI